MQQQLIIHIILPALNFMLMSKIVQVPGGHTLH